MEIGVLVPQGFAGEYAGWDPASAWSRTVAVAQQAERLGFESIWLFDHFQTHSEPRDEITFESFTSLAAMAALTTRVRIGHLVACAGFRNPALVAKMIATMDVISGGRMELGIGAGWNRDEWTAYGYGFPDTRDRLSILADSLEVITRALGPGHATYQGRWATVNDAINLPKGLQQPRIPIIVGGNGPNVTWRLAARFADELNLDGLSPDDTKQALDVVRSRCREVGRDENTLRISINMWWVHSREPGQPRVDRMAAYRELGISRVITLVEASAESDEALESLAADARAAGVHLFA